MDRSQTDPSNHVREQNVVTRAERQPHPLVDNAPGGITYTGYAPLGTPEDAASWLIIKTYVLGTITRTEYPNCSVAYNQKWSDRASLPYAR